MSPLILLKLFCLLLLLIGLLLHSHHELDPAPPPQEQLRKLLWIDGARLFAEWMPSWPKNTHSVLTAIFPGELWLAPTSKHLVTLSPRWIQEPSVVRDRDGRPPRRHLIVGKSAVLQSTLAVHCFCVCSGSVLLGDLLGVSRSRERDLLSVLSIYPWIFLCVFIVYHRIVRILCLLLYSAICWL